MRHIVLKFLFVCVALVGAACAQDDVPEQFAFNGIVVSVNESANASVDIDDSTPGNGPDMGAVVVRTDGTAEQAGFGECETAGDPNQTFYFGPGTTVLPNTEVDDPDFPKSLEGGRVGADGFLVRSGERCVAIADRVRVAQL